jgi:hypothetical protein
VIEAHEKRIEIMLQKMIGDKAAIKKAESYIKTKSRISVMINS